MRGRRELVAARAAGPGYLTRVPVAFAAATKSSTVSAFSSRGFIRRHCSHAAALGQPRW
jgi:hypothetical protein